MPPLTSLVVPSAIFEAFAESLPISGAASLETWIAIPIVIPVVIPVVAPVLAPVMIPVVVLVVALVVVPVVVIGLSHRGI